MQLILKQVLPCLGNYSLSAWWRHGRITPNYAASPTCGSVA